MQNIRPLKIAYIDKPICQMSLARKSAASITRCGAANCLIMTRFVSQQPARKDQYLIENDPFNLPT
jgi:hypothetical protein